MVDPLFLGHFYNMGMKRLHEKNMNIKNTFLEISYGGCPKLKNNKNEMFDYTILRVFFAYPSVFLQQLKNYEPENFLMTFEFSGKFPFGLLKSKI